MDLSSQVAIVSGAGSGIGRATALALASAGARLALCGRRREPLEETVEAIRSAGGRALGLPCDVCRPSQVDRFVTRVVDEFGPVGILVNNAGIGGQTPARPASRELWDRMVQTNLSAAFYCSSRVLEEMPRGGRIVNISSVLGKFGVPGYSAYCASKHGLVGLTRALALELAPRGITVNAICPGWVETEMARLGMESGARESGISYQEFRRQALSRVPLGEMIEPTEIAQLVLYLVSPAAAKMTGQAINLSGGQVMH